MAYKFLDKEDGDLLLLETGDNIILDTLYLISGIASLGGTPQAGVKITLIRSDNNTIYGTTTTDANGYYEFVGLNNALEYHSVAEFDDSPDLYNAESLPFLTPIR